MGTGGDGAGTFNVSTTVALAAAGAGLPIVKHGNRGVSSPSGAADVLEALGVPVDLTPEEGLEALKATNFAFCFARNHHPAMRFAAPVRKCLEAPTLFNLLGPSTNPLGRGGPPGRDRPHRHSSPPNADDPAARAVAGLASGYTYLLSRPGVTGAERHAERPAERLLAVLRETGALPALLGFGVATPEDVRAAIEAGAAGAISGSAVVRRIEAALPDVEGAARAVAEFVREMKAATRK